MSNDNNLKAAKKKVAAKKEFYKHLIIFGIGSVFFIVLNMLLIPKRIWFHIAILAWGIGGVLPHYLHVYGIGGVTLFGKKWEKEQIEKELEKIEKDEGYLELKDLKEDREKMKLKELRKNYDENDLV